MFFRRRPPLHPCDWTVVATVKAVPTLKAGRQVQRTGVVAWGAWLGSMLAGPGSEDPARLTQERPMPRMGEEGWGGWGEGEKEMVEGEGGRHVDIQ